MMLPFAALILLTWVFATPLATAWEKSVTDLGSLAELARGTAALVFRQAATKTATGYVASAHACVAMDAHQLRLARKRQEEKTVI